MCRRGILVIVALAVAVIVAAPGRPVDAQGSDGSAGAPACGPQAITLTGTATPEQAKTYELVPFRVPGGTERIEVAYEWTPVEQGVIDLGMWDATGTEGPEAFRFWSGSRQGRLDREMEPIQVTPDLDERTVVARRVMPGTWHVELGYAAVDATLDWSVELRCPRGDQASEHEPDRVDPTHVARDEAGWYAGDFHLHAYHSSPDGPTPDEMVAAALDAGLDIIPVTEYVTPAHWDRLGATQRKHADVLIWPGREVITYFGHMIVLSETPSVVEHRVGYQGITPGDIQRQAADDGALVSIAHPTVFPPDTFGSFCRGCFFERWDQVDWSATNLVEVVTDGAVAEIGGTDVPNPFVRTAVEKWESLLRDGHRLTAVSGSDDKEGDRYGNTITMVRAEQLSRAAVDEALRRGHAYVRGLGKRSEATMDLTATAPDGATATFGDALVAEDATLSIAVDDADGMQLAIRRDGTEVARVPVVGDHFVHEVPIARVEASGALGTFWGAEVLDTTTYPGSEVAVLIANPVFLTDTARPDPELPAFEAVSVDRTPTSDGSGTAAEDGEDDDEGGPTLVTYALLVGIAIVGAVGGSAAGRVYGRRRASRR